MRHKIPYLPILKWKESEVRALRSLRVTEKQNITPLFTLVPKEIRKEGEYFDVPPNEILNDATTRIQNLFGDIKVYFDLFPLFDISERPNAFKSTISCATLFPNNIVPVIYLEDVSVAKYEDNVLAFFKKQGICLRIQAIPQNNSLDDISKLLLEKLGIDKNKVDLLFDSQVTNKNIMHQFVSLFKNSHNMKEWRSVYFSSGNFPENLITYKVGNSKLERKDWILWKAVFNELRHLREPGYSDYTIQHPVYIAPPRTPFTSYSVRYTFEDHWLIMRGQADNAKNSKGRKQYFAHSKLLTLNGEYAGENCCDGCKFIKHVSEDVNGSLGNAPKWLTIGMCHHISLATNQLSSLN